MATKKIKTNEMMLKALFNDLSSLEAALLRERIVTIFQITVESIEKEPDRWVNPLVNPTAYIRLADKVNEFIGFDKD